MSLLEYKDDNVLYIEGKKQKNFFSNVNTTFLGDFNIKIHEKWVTFAKNVLSGTEQDGNNVNLLHATTVATSDIVLR